LFVERPWQFINIAMLRLLMQTGSHIAQEFSLAKSIIIETFDTAFA
jgi:hypothetical protein